MKLFLILVAFFLGTGTCLAHDYPDVNIYYEFADQVWEYNPKTQIKESIANGECPALSPDRKKLAYIYKSTNKYFRSEDEKSLGVHVFDLVTKKDKVLLHNTDEFIAELSWSPKGNYLVLDSGTYVIRGKDVIKSATGEIIYRFGVLEDNFAWLNEKEIVLLVGYTDKQNSWGISTINILSGKKKDLIQPTPTKTYYFNGVYSDKISYTLLQVKKPEDWENNRTIDVTYWLMNTNGKDNIQVAKIEDVDEQEKLRLQIYNVLPEPYKSYKSLWAITPLQNDNDWMLFILNQAGVNILDNEIFLMDIKQPASLQKVANGNCASW